MTHTASLIRHRILRSASVGVLGLLLAATAARAEDYKIKLTRPEKVGNEFVVTVNVKFDRTVDVTANGQAQPQKTDGFKAELHGSIKVLEVNARTGSATKLTCKVDTLTKDGDEFYPAGTKITAEKVDKKTVFTIDGETVDKEKTEVLDSLLSVGDPNRETTDDEMTGTDKPQEKGGTWPINAEKVAKDISEEGITVSADDLTGECKLVDVKKVNDVDAMVISTTVKTDTIGGKLPDGPAISSGKMNVKATAVYPVDPALPEIRESAKVHFEVTINIPGGVGKALISTDRETKSSREAVKE